MSLRMGLLIIEQVKSHKLLGIHKDQDLDFDAQSDALSATGALALPPSFLPPPPTPTGAIGPLFY